jgi:hypothetical protein
MSKNKTPPKKTTGQTKPDDFYSKIIIYPYRRHQLYLFLLIAFAFFAVAISQNLLARQSWMILLTPVLVIGGLICLIPKTEIWEYKPWQSQPRQIERHQIDRK